MWALTEILPNYYQMAHDSANPSNTNKINNLSHKLLYGFADVCFKHFFSFYKCNYFLYKRLTDGSKITFLKKHITPGMTVIDVGANIGFYTRILSDLVGPRGKVIAFEPDPDNFSRLQKVVSGAKNVVIHQLAVGKQTKNIFLFKSSNLNVDHHTYQSSESREKVKISCVSLDDFLKGESVDVVKMDVQGFEHEVLQGMKKIAQAKNKDLIILGELWPKGLMQAGTSAKAFLRALSEMSFTVSLESKNFDLTHIDAHHYTDIFAYKKSNKPKERKSREQSRGKK